MTNQNYPDTDDLIFIGRVEEQNRFRESLKTILRESSAVAKIKDWIAEKDPARLPFIFLLDGEGGMGKTRLAQRLCDIAVREAGFKGRFRSVWLDWEKRKELDYRLAMRDSVSPETVFEHIYAVFRDEGFGGKFNPYERALKQREVAEAKVAQVLDKVEGGDRYTVLREFGGKGLAWLVRSGMVSGVPIPIPQEPMAKAFEAIVGGGAEGLARAREVATTLVRSTLTEPDEFNLFTLPNETLARRLAECMRASAARQPIVFILDTYEIADRADAWLRVVVKTAGPRVLWIVSGRDNLADSRKFGQVYFIGYRADFSSENLRVFPLGEFSLEDVTAYFADRVPGRPLDPKDTEAIHRATLGIPLAVREAAAIWMAGKSLEDIVGEIPPRAPRKHIVQVMTERFLMHCFADADHPDDRSWLYALALAYRSNLDLIGAMFQSEDLEYDLSDLERRHSFVFVGEMKLHDAVTAFLREYLLQEVRRKSKIVRGINERAVAYLQDRQVTREKTTPTIEALVADEQWTAALLGLVHHSFWLNEDNGWTILLPTLMGGLAYDRGFARALVETVAPFTTTFTNIGQKRFKILNDGLGTSKLRARIQNRVYSDLFKALPEVDQEAALMAELEASVSIWPDDRWAVERRAILDLRQGQLFYNRGKYIKALTLYEKASLGLPEPDAGNALRESLGEALEDVGFKLGYRKVHDIYLPMPTEAAEKAYDLAITLGHETPGCYRGKGHIQIALGKRKAGLYNVRKSVELDPEGVENLDVLGNTFRILGRHQEAIASYQRATELDPEYASPYIGLGNVYYDLGRHQEAIDACERAIELDPESAYPHSVLGTVYHALGRDEEAIAAYQRAIELNPKYSSFHHNLADVYITQGRFDEAQRELNERIRLRPDNTFAPLVLLGVIARHQGLPESEEHFQGALAQWEIAWRDQLQSPAGLMENKAITLVCLNKRDEATKVLAEAITKMWPGDTIEFYIYQLLQKAPTPPEGVEQMIEMLRDAQVRREKGLATF